MGGYVGQAYAQLYPDQLAGFISIDFCTIAEKLCDCSVIWLLKEWNLASIDVQLRTSEHRSMYS